MNSKLLREYEPVLSGTSQRPVASCCAYDNEPRVSITWGKISEIAEEILVVRERICCVELMS